MTAITVTLFICIAILLACIIYCINTVNQIEQKVKNSLRSYVFDNFILSNKRMEWLILNPPTHKKDDVIGDILVERVELKDWKWTYYFYNLKEKFRFVQTEEYKLPNDK